MNHNAYMPFGKHKGRAVGSIESGYLAWLLGQPEICRKYPTVAAAAEAILAERNGDAAPVDVGDCIIIPRSLFNQWFRRLTARFHPDVPGGSHDAMLALNTARDELTALAVTGGGR